MSELKAKAMRTLARLREGKDLDTESFELVTNVMESFVMKLTTGERIRFQHVFGGYVIGTTAVSESVGLKYLYDLLQSGFVSCLHLVSGAPLPLGAESQASKDTEMMAVEYYDDDFEGGGSLQSNVVSADGLFYDHDDTEMDDRYLREVRASIKTLKKSGKSSEDLAMFEKILDESTYRGESKRHSNEREKARLSVRKAIMKAISRLIENPETKDIGLHLQDNIKFGHDCKYVGNWKWKFD